MDRTGSAYPSASSRNLVTVWSLCLWAGLSVPSISLIGAEAWACGPRFLYGAILEPKPGLAGKPNEAWGFLGCHHADRRRLRHPIDHCGFSDLSCHLATEILTTKAHSKSDLSDSYGVNGSKVFSALKQEFPQLLIVEQWGRVNKPIAEDGRASCQLRFLVALVDRAEPHDHSVYNATLRVNRAFQGIPFPVRSLIDPCSDLAQ